MKQPLIFSMIIAFSLIWTSCTPPEEKAEEAPAPKELTTLNEKISYVAGQDIGKSLKSRGTDIDLDIVIEGIQDSFTEKESLITPEDAIQVKKEYAKMIREEHEKKNKETAEKNKIEGDAFLAENKKKEGVKTTESGLQYEVITAGEGSKPKATDQVSVHYVGTLIDGTEFDSSHKRGQPATFFLNRVVKGWTEGLQLMPVGSKYRFYIPSELGYGERGAGPKIGPNATLTFEVELL